MTRLFAHFAARGTLSWLLLGVLLGAGLGGGCDWDFERMQVQPHYRSYEPSPYLPGNTVMQAPPSGTVPYDPASFDRNRAEASGEPGSGPLPVPIRAGLLARGQDRYGRFCSPCHGMDGAARTTAAARMVEKRPPSLHEPRLRALSPARLHRVITEGYGLMPGYGSRLSERDRWAVVAYVQCLQLSRGVSRTALPPHLQQEAAQWLR